MKRATVRLAACLSLVFAPAAALAQDYCEIAEPVQWPVCSVEMMAAAAHPSFTFELTGDVNLEAFAGGANSDLVPGAAKLSLGGVVSGSGVACASHLGSLPASGSDGAFSPQMADQIERYTGQTVESSEAASTVFQIYSPNLQSWRTGALGGPLAVRHGGIGGWPANSAAHLTIEMAGTTPSDLSPGESYPARAYVGSQEGEADSGAFFTDWRGRIVRKPDPLEPEMKLACEQLLRQSQAMLRAMQVPFEETMGREFQSYQCGSELGLIGTERRITEGSLQGEVTIERITEDAIEGRFELQGQAALYSETIEEDGGVDRDTKSEPLTVSGSFTAPNHRRTGYVTPGQIRVARARAQSGPGKDSRDGFEIAGHIPPADQKNVSWSSPRIRARFNQSVDPDSLENTAVDLVSMDAGGGYQTVPIELTRAEPNEVVIAPQEELKDGVRYQVELVTGGLRSQSGEVVESYSWDFYTMVDLDDREFVEAAPIDLVDQEEGIEPHVMQVAHEAPLIAGKPAVSRVYVKWAPRDEVDENWQVREFQAHALGLDADDQAIFDAKRKVFIKRPDLYSEDDRAAALNTVNLYGWTPDYQETPLVSVEIEPAEQCGDPRIFQGDQAVEYDSLQRELTIAYHFARVGPWRDAVPSWARSEGLAAMQGAREFTLQNFPVTDVQLESGSDVSFPDHWHVTFGEIIAGEITTSDGDPADYDDLQLNVNQVAYHSMSPGSSGEDIVVLFTPYEWLQRVGSTKTDLGATPFVQMSLVGAASTNAQPGQGVGKWIISRTAALTHEFGHVYGLAHVPFANDSAHRREICDAPRENFEGIEGFRMAPSGNSGTNKSYEEGNAEHPTGPLPLMFPCTKPKDRLFIMNEHYEALIEALR